MLGMRVRGKALEDEKVVTLWVVGRAGEYYIVKEFKDDEKAHNYYKSISIDDKHTRKRLKVKFCRHKEEKEVRVRGTVRYRVCVECSRGIYIEETNG